MLMISVYRSKLESTAQEEQKKMTSLKSQLEDSKQKEKELHGNAASAEKDSEDKKRQLGQRIVINSLSYLYPLWNCVLLNFGMINSKL